MADVSDRIGDREHLSVVAFNDSGRVLVVQKAGYSEMLWRLPHCERMRASAGYAAGQHVIDESAIRRLLKGTIGCDESGVGEMRDTGERACFRYPEYVHAYDTMTTQQLHRGQNLVFYTAELLCSASSFKKGPRVLAARLVMKEVAAELLLPPENDVVLRAMSRYVCGE